MGEERRLWGIHAGRKGEAEALFEEHNVIALGWPEMGDLNQLTTRDEVKGRYEHVYPGRKPMSVAVNTGQLYRFAHEMEIGDVIVWPLKRAPEIWLGQITDEYVYNPKLHAHYRHTRKVEWLNRQARTEFSQGALYEIGSALTVFQVRNYADEFLTALEGKGHEEPSDEEEEEAIGLVTDEVERQSRDFVRKQLRRRLKGHGFAEFVGHLLRLMGYKTIVSSPGPDRGIDIEAYKDDLGAEQPRILVQVKSSDAEVNEAAVSQLYGKVSEKEFALFVALGGFRKHAWDFAFGKHNLKLVDGDGLVELVYQYYDRLDGKYKAIIPLRRVFIPEALGG